MALRVRLTEQLASLSTSISVKLEPAAVSRIKRGIHNALCYNNEGATFIPNIELEKLLTREAIAELIMTMANMSPGELDDQISAIVDQIDPRHPKAPKDSRKRILAILIMVGIPSSIIHFLEADIWDRHLPFEYQKHTSDGQLEYSKDDGSLAICPFQCFDFDHAKLHTFQVSQWDYMAPSFTFTARKAHHYQIQYSIPLPFTEGTTVPIQGGSSQVTRVVIHEGHHDLVCSSYQILSLMLILHQD